jgi:FG-GAP-like repeat
VVLSYGLVSGQALAGSTAQLPTFDSWCAFIYPPEELLSIPAGHPVDLAEADMDGDGQVEILLTTVETNAISSTWKCHLFRIVNPLPIEGSTIGQLAVFDGVDSDWGLTGLQQGFVSQIAVGDINHDGLDDVVVVVQKATANSDIYTSKVVLVLGDSTGEFEILEIPLDLGFFASGRILLADLDGDGGIDIVIPDPLYQRLVILWDHLATGSS